MHKSAASHETAMNEDDFLRFRIYEKLNQILRDVYELPARLVSINEMTGNILTVLDKIKSDDVMIGSIENAIAAIMKQMGLPDTDMAEARMEVGDVFAGSDNCNKIGICANFI